MKKIILAIMVMTWLVTGCSTFPKDDIKVESEVDPKVNMSAYKTYTWVGSVEMIRDPHVHWVPPKFDASAEIQYLVNDALRKHGMSEVNNNPDVSVTIPDLYVTYGVGVDMESLRVKFDPESKISNMESVPLTALVVVLTDAETGYVAWASVATGEIKNLDSETAKKRLGYVVDTMFKDLPK